MSEQGEGTQLTTQDSLAAPATESLEALVARAKRNKRGYSCRNDRFLALVAELEQLRAQVAGAPTSVKPPPVNVEVLAGIIGGVSDIVRRLPRGGYWGRELHGLTDAEVLVWWPLPPCPRCGDDGDLLARATAHGRVDVLYERDEDTARFAEVMDLASIWFEPGKRVWCGGCGKLRVDLEIGEDRHVHRKERR